MRRSPQKAKDLESVATRLGRYKHNRGKEPMWMSGQFTLPPLAIPHHGGRDVPTGTKNSILNQLEDDILEWEDWIEEHGNGDEEGEED